MWTKLRQRFGRRRAVEAPVEEARSRPASTAQAVAVPPAGDVQGGRTMTVKYLGLAQNVAETAEEQVQVPDGATVKTLLEVLVKKHGEDLQAILLTMNGTLRASASVLVDGKDVDEVDGLETGLDGVQEACVLILVDPISGG